MKKDYAVIDILSNPKLYFLFNMMKTSRWKTLSESNKRNFYLKVNDFVCKTLNIESIDLVVGDGEINEDTFISKADYKNIIMDMEQRPYINDVNYNQYLTLYEYFFRLRVHLLQLTFMNEYNAFFDERKKEQINKNFRYERLGNIYLKMDKDDMEEYEDYQFINMEAREFAETILFKIVKNNYDMDDGYDEEFFMSNYNVLLGEYVKEIGEYYLNEHIFSMSKYMNKLKLIRDKLGNLTDAKLSKLDDRDLFFIVYPSVIDVAGTKTIIRGFNEIIKRIYSDEVEITWRKTEFIVNNHVYDMKNFDNLFNIVLYECLNDITKQLSSEYSEKEIYNYKKNWLFSVVRKIDGCNFDRDFGVLKYQTLYRLLNKEKLEFILNSTSGDYFPLSKGGNRK